MPQDEKYTNYQYSADQSVGGGLDHEKDPRWRAVDEYVLAALHPPSKLQSALDAAIKHQKDSGLPDIAVSALGGSFLALQCQLLGSRRVLEVGTLAGYSTIWFASANEGIHVTTVDIEKHHTDVARHNVSQAGYEANVEFITAPGKQALEKLVEEVKAGKREPYDFVFIDADKEGNLDYVNLSLEMTVKGACIIVDNVVRRGKVANAALIEKEPAVGGARRVIEACGKDSRLQCSLLQTVGEKNYDGMLLCRKK